MPPGRRFTRARQHTHGYGERRDVATRRLQFLRTRLQSLRPINHGDPVRVFKAFGDRNSKQARRFSPCCWIDHNRPFPLTTRVLPPPSPVEN